MSDPLCHPTGKIRDVTAITVSFFFFNELFVLKLLTWGKFLIVRLPFPVIPFGSLIVLVCYLWVLFSAINTADKKSTFLVNPINSIKIILFDERRVCVTDLWPFRTSNKLFFTSSKKKTKLFLPWA